MISSFLPKLKLVILYQLILVSISYAQSNEKKGTWVGSLESNSQYYFEDKSRMVVPPDQPFRSNTYLSIQYNLKKWTAGLQLESYLPNAILNMNPQYKGVGLGTAYINYKTKKADYTIGHFYDQFGSGLIFRAWEDRSLGINNSVLGARIHYNPVPYLHLTALGGRQRSGFTLSNGMLAGLNAELEMFPMLHKANGSLAFGFSYFGRYESTHIAEPNFDLLTNSFSERLKYTKNNFFASLELVQKSNDGIINNLVTINNDFVKPGSAFLANVGYSKNGKGLNFVWRRIENMNFLSEREPTIYGFEQSSLNYNDKILNYVPSINKQHTYSLSNIYVFQAQKLVSVDPFANIGKAGEIGGMIDFFYDIKKGTKVGGKHGTKIELAMSSYYNLAGSYTLYPANYSTEWITTGQEYFSDYSVEITKKFNSSLNGNLEFVKQSFNNRLITGAARVKIETSIISTRWWMKTGTKSSTKLYLEHMWASSDRKNWIAGMIEYNFNSKLSVYASDMYNYGYDPNGDLIDHITDPFDIHFYSFGGTYKKGTFRATLNVGRQRGGLVCTGGICRYVPPSTGVGLSVIKVF